MSNIIDGKLVAACVKKRVAAEVAKLTDLFKDKNNPWVTKARTLNARFTALSVLVLVPVFLGFMLPAINERATKKRIKEEQEAMKLQQDTNLKSIDASMFTQNANNIFSDIQNFAK